MTITEKDRPKQTNFGSLSNGDLFRYEDEYYIKISTEDTDGANCVHLEDGLTLYVDLYDEVQKIEKYELIINE